MRVSNTYHAESGCIQFRIDVMADVHRSKTFRWYALPSPPPPPPPPPPPLSSPPPTSHQTNKQTNKQTTDLKMNDGAEISPVQIAVKVATHRIRPKIPSDCPPSLSQLITQCWEHDPKKRLSSEELVAILEDV